ncbi:MAG: PEP-utilizing enzyme [Candidatus Levybacteria bacterium]|nr:PEP-utilizing enzyme [Candidatus Levybacteria bacterium]
MTKVILKGTAASLGIVKGKVKVILNPSECNKVEKGDIMVVEMTDPLYMTGIMKAGGLITDIGGLLSHAAIVAREMGIPCLVNTKKGTKVLKDNQIVIIDAEKGEVYGK